MKKWHIKAFIQKTISFLPGGNRINFFFQKYVTKGVFLSDEYFVDRLTHAKEHLHAFYDHANVPLDSTLELGTGWYPVVPISLFLSGAKNITTLDISPLCNKERLLTTLDKIIASYDKGELAKYITIIPEQISIVKRLELEQEQFSFEEMLYALNITYLIKDARKLDLPAASICLVHSNNTFEHVYTDVLKSILIEFKRLTAVGGIMSHFVDMSDHFAHSDKSITIYNFLKYSEKKWNRIDNSIQPQNRMRITHYRKIYKELGIPITKEELRPGNLAELNSVNVHKEFSNIPPEELAVSHCLLISQL